MGKHKKYCIVEYNEFNYTLFLGTKRKINRDIQKYLDGIKTIYETCYTRDLDYTRGFEEFEFGLKNNSEWIEIDDWCYSKLFKMNKFGLSVHFDSNKNQFQLNEIISPIVNYDDLPF